MTFLLEGCHETTEWSSKSGVFNVHSRGWRMSEQEFGIQEKPSTNPGKNLDQPLQRLLIQRRSEFYAEWIASHPILWGWILFATFNTVADIVVHFFFFEASFYGLTAYHLLLWTVAAYKADETIGYTGGKQKGGTRYGTHRNRPKRGRRAG